MKLPGFQIPLLLVGACLLAPPAPAGVPEDSVEEAPDTRVTRLFAEAAAQGWFSSGSDREILAEVLDRLDVPVESQVLVFSKTSAQNPLITPENPRAIYFSDDVYVGWVPGGEIETASFDPIEGLVFHLVKLSDRQPSRPPEVVRERSCLNCHAGSATRDLPGLMVRSVHPTASGLPLFEAGTFHTRQSSPIEQRWGGWYVTGEVEGRTHLGNHIARPGEGGEGIELEALAPGKTARLEGLFREQTYLHGGRSDVVALMVLEHQVGVHNVLVEANLATRATLARHEEMRRAFGEPLDAPLSETNERILANLATKVLREMLYVDEVALPGGIEGSREFQEAFARNRRKNSEGRSLRDFRLYERLMKYRCSHLIESEAFAMLPGAIRDRILGQLHDILTDPGAWPDFAHLSDSERGHLHSILGETLPDLPPTWRR